MWYVIQTSTGREEKIKQECEQRISKDVLSHCVLPLYEEKIKYKGQWHIQKKKLFPGYVLINMVMNDDTWYVVRNTRGVTGFVGPGSKPVPLTEEEIGLLGIQPEAIEIDYAEGDSVVVTGGAWKDTTGMIQSINRQKQLVTINVELFGRETPVEISFAEVKKM